MNVLNPNLFYDILMTVATERIYHVVNCSCFTEKHIGGSVLRTQTLRTPLRFQAWCVESAVFVVTKPLDERSTLGKG